MEDLKSALKINVAFYIFLREGEAGFISLQNQMRRSI
jgi:hypothetical protein